MELVTGHTGSNHITALQVSRLLKGVTATDESTVYRLNVDDLCALSYSDITVSIEAGEMLLNGFHVTLTDDTGGTSGDELVLDATVEETNSRIDKIVLEVIQDNTTSYQTAEIVIVQGEEAESPVAPDTPTEPDLSTQEFLAVGVIAQVTVTADAITAFTDYTDLYGGNYATVSDFESIWESNNILGAKNLIPYPYANTTKTSDGITWTDNGDGSITANGTATATTRFGLATSTDMSFLEEGQTYILNGCPSGGSSSTYAIYTQTVNYFDSGDGVTFTMESSISGIAIVIYSGVTVSDVTFYPMIRLAADTDDTYEPYAMTNSKLTEVAREVPYYATSSTAASTTAKVATTNQTGFALVTGAKVIVKFTYTNTATAPTLNVNGTGAKTIYGYGTTTPSLWWLAGDVVEFTYNGTYWLMQPTQGQIETINSNLTYLNTYACLTATATWVGSWTGFEAGTYNTFYTFTVPYTGKYRLHSSMIYNIDNTSAANTGIRFYSPTTSTVLHYDQIAFGDSARKSIALDCITELSAGDLVYLQFTTDTSQSIRWLQFDAYGDYWQYLGE